MILSARMLENVTGVNGWDYVAQARFTVGDTVILYFQLVDASRDIAEAGFSPAGRRHVAGVSATLTATIDNLNDEQVVSRAATRPYSNDGSIWSLALLSTDVVRGTSNLRLKLIDGATTLWGVVKAAVNALPQAAV